MHHWTITPIEEEPTVELEEWSVFEVQLASRNMPTCHLCGHRRQNPFGKVSSPICEVDPARRRLSTESGQVYELLGGPGVSTGIATTRTEWLAKYRLNTFTDVTDEFVRLLEE